MQVALYLIGLSVLVFGTFFGFASSDPIVILFSIVGGFILLGIAKLIEINEEIRDKLFQMLGSYNQHNKFIDPSILYEIGSTELEVDRSQYSIVILDDEQYIDVNVFFGYLSQAGDEYKFELPNQGPLIAYKSHSYYKGAELFEYQEQTYVMLKKINLRATINGNSATLEYLKGEGDINV